MEFKDVGIEINNPDFLSEDVIKAANLDWEVALRRTSWFDDSNNEYQMSKDFAIVRTDINRKLGLAKSRYGTIQNKDAFRFMDSLIASGQMEYVAGGSVRNGQKVWIAANIGKFDVISGDTLEKNLLFYNTHDGTGKLRVLIVSKRIACSNMIQAILNNQKHEGLSLMHTTNISTNLEASKAQEILGLTNHKFDQYKEYTQYLASKQISSQQMNNFVVELFPDPEDKEKQKATVKKREQQRADIIELFENGRGTDIQGVKGTAWGAYNAVTEYLNYKTNNRGANPEERRFENLLLKTPDLLIKANRFLAAA